MATKHRTGYLFKRGGVYYLEYMVEGKRIKQSLRTAVLRKAKSERDRIMKPLEVAQKGDALRAVVQKLEANTEQLTAIDENDNPPLNMTKAWDEYKTSSNRPDSGPATLKQYSYQFKAFIDWLNVNHPHVQFMRDVTKDIAEEFASHLSTSKRSGNTFNKYINLVSLVFRTLADKAKLVKNPWEGIGHKRSVAQGRRELTVEELQRVCDSATGELRTLFAIGLYTGMRLGDCVTLRWAEVDIIRGQIRRIPSKTARRNPKPVVIPIHPTLKGVLAEIPQRHRAEYVLPALAARHMKQPYSVVQQIQSHFEKCSVRTTKPGTGPDTRKKDKKGKPIPGSGIRAATEVGFHSLRHTFVSMCREANAPLSVVEAIVGHSNPAMTRHYTHVGELAATQAVAALPALIPSATVPAGKAEPKSTTADLLKAIEQIVSTMTPKTCLNDKQRLLDFLRAHVQ